MRTEQLYYLCETANLGSMNAAAEKLHLSQQGLNAALKSLEKDVGYTLFTTSRQGIELTPEGKLVVETAEKVLDLLDEMNRSLNQQQQMLPVMEFVSLQVAPVVSAYLLPDIFQNISDKYSRIAISLNEQNPLQLIGSVDRNECDIAIFGLQYQLFNKLGLTSIFSENLEFVPLYQYKLSIAVSDQHPLAKYKSISIKTVIQYPLVLYMFDSVEAVEDDLNYQWLKLYGEPQIKFATSSRDIYQNILMNGSAIGLFPSIRHHTINISLGHGIKLIPLKDEDAVYTVGYLYNKAIPISHAMRTVMDELEAFCK